MPSATQAAVDQQQLNPTQVFQALSAHELTSALKAAIELDLFTAIADGSHTAAEIAGAVHASERGVRILADFLVIHSFLNKNSTGYLLTPNSAAFLNRRSPTYIGSTAQFLVETNFLRRWENLTDAVRNGGAKHEQSTVDPAHHEHWVAFARGMAPMMMPVAQAIASQLPFAADTPLRVLDIAASHCLFGLNVARVYPKAHITAVDFEAVLAVGKENAQRFGLADRLQFLPGDAFAVEFGTGYDLVLVTNFLHHFDTATNEQFLRKCAAALNTGGVVAIAEFVPNEDRVTPPAAAAFALKMLNGTESGDAYTLSALEFMLRHSGFKHVELRALEPFPQSLVLARKA